MSITYQRSFWLAVVLLNSIITGPHASAASISAAKALPLGTLVTLEDVVISTTVDLTFSGASATFSVQDSTGGTQVFASNADIATLLTGLAPGDRIEVTGATASFNGLFQLAQPSLATSLVSASVGVPNPIVTTASDYQDSSITAEGLENQLVSLAGVQFTDLVPGQIFAGGTSYTVTDGLSNVTVRIQTAELSLVGDLIPTGKVNLSGIFTQFDSTNPLPGVAGIGYQIMPLDDSSIVLVPEPASALLDALMLVMGIALGRSR